MTTLLDALEDRGRRAWASRQPHLGHRRAAFPGSSPAFARRRPGAPARRGRRRSRRVGGGRAGGDHVERVADHVGDVRLTTGSRPKRLGEPAALDAREVLADAVHLVDGRPAACSNFVTACLSSSETVGGARHQGGAAAGEQAQGPGPPPSRRPQARAAAPRPRGRERPAPGDRPRRTQLRSTGEPVAVLHHHEALADARAEHRLHRRAPWTPPPCRRPARARGARGRKGRRGARRRASPSQPWSGGGAGAGAGRRRRAARAARRDGGGRLARGQPASVRSFCRRSPASTRTSSVLGKQKRILVRPARDARRTRSPRHRAHADLLDVAPWRSAASGCAGRELAPNQRRVRRRP